jgi:tetratricopeptide (TPR) repeat protein
LLAIALIGFAALVLRVWALDFGLPSWLHPDEFSFVFLPLNFYGGDLNPHFFTYPTFHYYLLSLVYLAYFLWENVFGAGHSFEQFIALNYFWDRSQLMGSARLLSALYGAGTVVWVALLARRVAGGGAARFAGLAAGALLAVGVVHLRQSYLAGVDAAMTFYFVGAVWAAVRLLASDRLRDYLLAGALVGLAAACKYPGALAGIGVIAAHLISGRRLWVWNIWLAGLVSAGVFVVLSPYILLDFSSFETYFSAQVGQMHRGRGGDLGRGWWYHLHFSLVVNGGWLALLLLALGAVETLRRRRAEGLVVLAAFLGYYAIMGSGQTVFTRYALPLMALQAVLFGGYLARIEKQAVRILLLALTLAQPLHASWYQVHLLAQEDTRIQARAWIEANVPAGAVLGNFGGWAGDVRLRTFEGLWWEVSHFERIFGRERMDRAVAFLAERAEAKPFYSYALQRTNMAEAAGSMAEIERFETAWVVLHRHSLDYSRVDSIFAGELATRADRVAHFTPSVMPPVANYDVLDAFYLPLGDYGALDRPGPDIEIWKFRDYPDVQEKSVQIRRIFARAYVTGVASALGAKKFAEAEALAERALGLDGELADAWYLLGVAQQLVGDLEGSEESYRRRLQLDGPAGGKAEAARRLGVVYEDREEWHRAEQFYIQALDLAPWRYSLVLRMANYYRRRGQPEKVLRLYEERRHLFVDRGEFLEALGEAYENVGLLAEATAVYAHAVQQKRVQPETYLRLVKLYGRQRNYDLVIETSLSLLAIDPKQAEAHRLLAFVLNHQGRGGEAVEHARAYIRLLPEGENAVELKRWLQDGNIHPEK